MPFVCSGGLWQVRDAVERATCDVIDDVDVGQSGDVRLRPGLQFLCGGVHQGRHVRRDGALAAPLTPRLHGLVEGVSSQKGRSQNGRSQNGRESTNHRICWDRRFFFNWQPFLRPFWEATFLARNSRGLCHFIVGRHQI